MVNFTSLNGYGTYNPANVTIPSPGSYSLSPLEFIPNPGFNGGDDFIVLSIAEVPCITLHSISYGTLPSAKMMAEDTFVEEYGATASLRITPNPASELVAVSYDVGSEYNQAEYVLIYNMNGILVSRIALKSNKHDLPLNISNFPAGTYIVTLQADGKTVLHQKLIKK